MFLVKFKFVYKSLSLDLHYLVVKFSLKASSIIKKMKLFIIFLFGKNQIKSKVKYIILILFLSLVTLYMSGGKSCSPKDFNKRPETYEDSCRFDCSIERKPQCAYSEKSYKYKSFINRCTLEKYACLYPDSGKKIKHTIFTNIF